LAAVQPATTFTVTWSGGDATSGVACYDLQVRHPPDGTWADWASCTGATALTFDGVDTEEVCFRSRARDSAGNWEDLPADPHFDTCTTVCLPLAAPALVTPDTGAAIPMTTASFSWQGVAGAVAYRIQVARSPDFAAPLIDARVETVGFTAEAQLPVGEYYWRVAGVRECGDGLWSPTRSVSVEGLQVFLPVALSLSSAGH
jgi:hypothetical protein